MRYLIEKCQWIVVVSICASGMSRPWRHDLVCRALGHLMFNDPPGLSCMGVIEFGSPSVTSFK